MSWHVSVVSIEGNHLSQLPQIFEPLGLAIDESFAVFSGEEAQDFLDKNPTGDRMCLLVYFENGWTAIADTSMTLVEDPFWEELSRKSDQRVLSWVCSGGTGTYALKMIQAGKKVRDVWVCGGEINTDEGEPLPEEQGLNWETVSEEDIFGLGSRIGPGFIGPRFAPSDRMYLVLYVVDTESSNDSTEVQKDSEEHKPFSGMKKRISPLVRHGMMPAPDQDFREWLEWITDAAEGPLVGRPESDVSITAHEAMNALFRQGRMSEARELGGRLGELYRDSLFPYNITAAVASEQYKFDRVIRILNGPLQYEKISRGETPVYPENWSSAELLQALFYLAKALYEQRQLKEALQVLELLNDEEKYKPSYAVRNLFGLCRLRLEQYEDAIKDFKEANEFFEARMYHYGHDNMGRCYYQLGRYSEALEHFSEGLRINPQNAWGYKNRARVYEKLGKPDLAEVDWQNCVKYGGQRPRSRRKKRSGSRRH